MADMLLFCACEDSQTDAPKSAPEDPVPPPPGEDYGDAGKENAAGDVNRARGGAAPTVISSDAVAIVPGSEPAKLNDTPLEDLNTFVARLRDPGFFVTKYSHRAQLGGKKPRVLFTDETGKKLGWKAPAGASKSRAEKENCMVEITEISEVRAASDGDPSSVNDEEPLAGTATLRAQCAISVAPRAFSLILADRTVDLEVESEEQALYMIKNLRALVAAYK